MNSAAVAVIVAIFASITAPLILAVFTARMHRQDREADWKRQDQLAAKAAAGAAAAAKETNGKLDVIHTLVNSQLTAAMQAEYDATVAMLAMMREVVDLKRSAGREPTPEALAALDAAQAKVAELGTALTERARAQDRANKRMRPPGD